tara:strand:- start:162060 stop:162530 length:471 start_codon:yes stop_codon:yes gene_type:complete
MNNFLVITITILVSILLTMVTFALGPFAPDWILLVMIYWALALPTNANLYTSWFVGILADVAYGSILGINALTYTVIGYLIIKAYRFLRYMTIYQQTIIIFLLLFLKETFNMWINLILDTNDFSYGDYYWKTLTSAIAWPIIFYSLRSIRRKYNVI